MNKFRMSALFCLTLLTCLLSSSSVFACACCAEPGYYSIRTAKLTEYEAKELLRLKFETADLYSDAGYPDSIAGINPLGENYSINSVLNGKFWAFDFKDNNQKIGRLDLAKPLSMVEFMVELPSAEKPQGEVKLYKEWRFKYRVQNATGIFKNGFAATNEYFLVLQGYGNVCTSAEDFKKWHLDISGRRAGFSFFGNLSAVN